MRILHIDSLDDANQIDKLIQQGHDVFILVYMVGCGPCNATRPEWKNLESALKHQYKNNNKLVIIDVSRDFMKNVKMVGEIDGFPSMKYISNKGKTVETYENSGVKKKDRSVSSFINWIESKMDKVVSTNPSSSKKVYERLATKRNNPHNRSSHRQMRHKRTRRNRRRSRV